jgi:hypothetical protein
MAEEQNGSAGKLNIILYILFAVAILMSLLMASSMACCGLSPYPGNIGYRATSLSL